MNESDNGEDSDFDALQKSTVSNYRSLPWNGNSRAQYKLSSADTTAEKPLAYREIPEARHQLPMMSTQKFGNGENYKALATTEPYP